MSIANYPPGVSDNTIDAPWNMNEPEEKDFKVTCSQCLSKTVTVTTTDYIPGASGVDYETDEEGQRYAVPYEDTPDTSNTNWAKEYHTDSHLTPLELISLYKETLERQLKGWQGLEDTIAGKREIDKIEHLIEECNNWCDNETEFIED